MDLKSYEYRDPRRLIEEVAGRVPLRAGDVYLVLVSQPSEGQQIERVQLLDLDAEQDDYQHAEDEVRQVVTSWALPDVRPPQHGVMTVVVRPGLTVFGSVEYGWLTAWRFSNHCQACYDTDLILVTEHGWVDLMTQWGGHTPAMVAA